jgi:hypothetical protein
LLAAIADAASILTRGAQFYRGAVFGIQHPTGAGSCYNGCSKEPSFSPSNDGVSMRVLLLFVLAVCVAPGNLRAAVNFQFVRISQPPEDAELSNGSQIAGAGFVHMPEAEKKEDFEVRVRLYRPIAGDFEVIREVVAEIGPGFRDEASTWQYKFNLNLERAVSEGKYLLWVDCFDKSVEEPKLLASASEFVTLAELAKKRPGAPAEADPPAEQRPFTERRREYRMVRIVAPEEGSRYSSTANISGVGYVFLSRGEVIDDFAMRVRLYRPAVGKLELIQEMQVPVAALEGMPLMVQYVYTLERKMALKAGKYLLKVDCLDVSEEEPPVLVSATRFLTVVELGKNKE